MKLKIISLVITIFFFQNINAEKSLVIYSSRQEQLIKPILDDFSSKTGTKIDLHTDKSATLINRLEAEGKNSQADILLTVDAGNLWLASNKKLLSTIESKIINESVESRFRDKKGEWVGLSIRARTIVYNDKLVSKQELSTYQALGDPKWKGKLCLRTSNNVYNQSLIAMFIAEYGKRKTKQIISSWINNLATKVFPSDTTLLKAIASGQCYVGITNSYYLARLINKNKSFPVSLFWANQNNNGVHVNISGAGVVKHTRNKQKAIEFLEYMVGIDAQRLYTNIDFEYPINSKVKTNKILESWGEFKSSYINVENAGKHQIEAIKLMDEVGYR